MASNTSFEADCHIPRPFQLEWLVGFDSSVNILNLTVDPLAIVVAVSSGHVLSVYYDNTRSVHHLIGGHVSAIHQLDCDASGRFLVSTSIDCCVVWKRPSETGQPFALRMIERPFGASASIDVVSMSADAKYLIVTGTVDNETTTLQFWIWSAGRVDPDAICDLPCQSFGRIRSITFDPFSSNTRFAVTLARNVLFGTWCEDTNSVRLVTPRKIGQKMFNMTTFTPCSDAVSVTDRGQGTFWKDVSSTGEYNEVKSVKISSAPLIQIDFVDDKLVLLDETGRFRFFDQQLKIVYQIDKEQSISAKHFIFNLCPRSCRVFRHDEFELNPLDVMESEMLFEENLSRCMSVEQGPFVMRNCLVVTTTGHIMCCDLVNKTNKELCVTQSPAVINSFDVSFNKNLICGGCSDGRIFLYDYVARTSHKSIYLMDSSDEVRKPVDCVLFTKCQRFVVVAIDSTIQIINVLLMKQVGKRIKPTQGTVASMCWSESGDLLAYYDSELKTVLLSMKYETNGPRLNFVGKNRSHNDTITAMLFVGNNSERLVTYSEDFYFTEYDVPTSILEGELRILHRNRYDQMAKPLCAIQLVDKESSSKGIGPCILTCGSMFKCKYWHLNQMHLLKTVVGPVLDKNPIRLLRVLDADKDDDKRYAVFATKGMTIGLQLLPFTGNAFRHVGFQGHANPIIQLLVLPDGNTVMSLGKNEFSISIWSVNRMAVDHSYELGGTGLMPYVKSLPGGRDGWLFREMQDLFYYMQIVTTYIDSPEEHSINETIIVSDVPSFMRALGYFPSEYEVNTMLDDITDQRPNMAKHLKVSFGELLKMYVNYKPVFGYPVEVLRRTFAYFSGIETSDSRLSIRKSKTPNRAHHDDNWLLDRDILMDICCSHGEHMSRYDFAKHLRWLLTDDGPLGEEYLAKGKMEGKIADNLLSSLPEVFNIHDILSNIFGLTLQDSTDGDEAGIYANVLDPGEVDEQLKNNFKEISAEDDNVMWED